MMKKNKAIKRKITMVIIMLAIIAIVLTILLIFFTEKDTITFYINKKEAKTLSKEIEYSDSIDYSEKAIQLTVKKNNKDITKKIKYNKVKITKLKTYKIIYEVDDVKFIYHMKVVDKTAPEITGETAITIKQNETFDQAVLNLVANDNYDRNITDKMTCEGSVDTAIPNEYELLYKVIDSSDNLAQHKVIVTVEEVRNDKYSNNDVDNQTQNNVNIINNPNDITVLINKLNKLPDGWVPNDLVSIGNNHSLRSEAAASLNQMRSVAQNSSIPFNVVSSYRTQAYQKMLYQNYFAVDPINAPYYSALPRTSEHELGLAIDISYDSALHDDLHNSSLGQWMATHAHEYGWIMRYPYGKTAVTGYVFEAWHYRYVGTALATQLRNSNLTMEEYY